MKVNINPKTNSTLNNKTGSWRTFRPKVDLNKCTGCGNCVRICPEGIIVLNNKKAVINYDFCKGCGLCSSECPIKAIIMELDEK